MFSNLNFRKAYYHNNNYNYTTSTI